MSVTLYSITYETPGRSKAFLFKVNHSAASGYEIVVHGVVRQTRTTLHQARVVDPLAGVEQIPALVKQYVKKGFALAVNSMSPQDALLSEKKRVARTAQDQPPADAAPAVAKPARKSANIIKSMPRHFADGGLMVPVFL